jgi:hypothetical protein
MTSNDSEIAAARFDWEEGLRRISADTSPSRELRNELSFAVMDELRRRLGITFSIAELARAYRTSHEWYFELAARFAPGDPDAWDPAIALDAGFARMARLATDAPGRGRG